MTEKQIKSVITTLKAIKQGLYETDEEIREIAMVLISEILEKPK